MLGHELQLAVRSFRRNRVLTLLMVLAIALGIGAAMTTLTVYTILAADPLPGRSQNLYIVHLDPQELVDYVPGEEPQDQLSRFDAEALLREKRESLGPDDVLEFTVRNVKHWSVVHPLLAHDQWSAAPDQLRFFTLDELGDLLEKVGLEGVEVETHDDPLPDELMPLVEVASAYGAEREETQLRLGAYEYTVVAKRA